MIRCVAVLGAGTMGAQIAAHVANAGLSVLLLDLDDRTAREGLKRAKALRPGITVACRLPKAFDCSPVLNATTDNPVRNLRIEAHFLKEKSIVCAVPSLSVTKMRYVAGAAQPFVERLKMYCCASATYLN